METNCRYSENCNKKDCNAPFCIRKYKLDALYSYANLAPIQLKHVPLTIDADGTDHEQYTQVVNIINNIKQFVADSQNLYLHSCGCGVGKTILATRAIKAYIEAIWAESELKCRALFVDVPTFLIKLKENISTPSEEMQQLKQNILSADLVVWDEIGNKTGTEFELNQLLCYINDRITQGKSNIYTSNCNTATMYQLLGNRLASRICNFSTDIEFFGKDKRAISPLKQN